MTFDCPSCGEFVECDVLEESQFGAKEGGGRRIEWKGRLVRCAKCGMGRLVPLPPADVLQALYEREYYEPQLPQTVATRSVQRRLKIAIAKLAADAAAYSGHLRGGIERAAIAFIEHVGARTVPVTTSFPVGLAHSAAILDYGCGGGWWLHTLLNEGYNNLWGFDLPNPALDDLEGAGIRVIRAGQPLPARTFDCIRLEHVFEHLADPVATLSELAGALRQGGSIVLALPNFDSWSSRTAGSDWNSRALPFHVSQFNERSLRNIASRVGLRVDTIQFLPIWESAEPTLRRRITETNPFWGKAFRLGATRPFLKRIYYSWSKARLNGDFLAMRMSLP